jgi:hypothetical protein
MHVGAAGMSQQSWGGGMAEGVDLGTGLPYGPRALLIYSSPSIDLVKRLHSPRMIGERPNKERDG